MILFKVQLYFAQSKVATTAKIYYKMPLENWLSNENSYRNRSNDIDVKHNTFFASKITCIIDYLTTCILI